MTFNGLKDFISHKMRMSHVYQPEQKITPGEFLSSCDEKSRQFFRELLKCAEAEGYKLLWGTKCFSLRLELKEGVWDSLFYGFPPGAHGGNEAFFHAYLGYMDNQDIRNRLQEKLSEVADFELKGKYTPQVLLAPKTADSLRPKLRELLRDAKEIVMG